MTGYAQSLIAHSGTAALVALVLFILLFTLFTARARAGLRVPLRPIRHLRHLPGLTERSVETGAPVVVWLAEGLQDVAGPESVAGLSLYDFVSRQAARSDQPAPLATSNPITLLLAMNILQASREYHQFHESYRPRELQFYGPSPFTFASGVTLDAAPAARSATVLAGAFELEGLWLGESMLKHDMPALAAVVDPAGASLVSLRPDADGTSRLTAEQLLPGEDLYAAGAYLHRPLTLGSLLAEDWARGLIIVLILIAVLLTSLGYGG